MECTGVLRRFSDPREFRGVGISPLGEEEVKVAKSEAPVTTRGLVQQGELRDEAE